MTTRDFTDSPKWQHNPFASILALSRTLTINQPLDQQLTQIAQAIEKYLGYRLVIVNLYDPIDRVFRARAGVGVPPAILARMMANPLPEEHINVLFNPQHQISSSYFIPASGWNNPNHVNNPPPWAYYPEFNYGNGADAWQRGDDLLVPIRLADGSFIGFISVDAPVDERRPALEKVQILEIFANQAATAIQNSRLYEQARMQAVRLVVLNEIGRVLSATLDLPMLYRTIVAETRRVLLVDAAYIVLYDNTTQRCETTFWIDQDEVWSGCQVFALDDGPASHVIRTKRPYVVNQPSDPIQARGGSFGDMQRASASALHVPMLIGERVIGVISVQSYKPNAYCDEDLQIISTIASQAAVAIENARLVNELQHTIESLKMAQDQLVRHEKLAALGQLVAGVAHELNNPLTSVMGFTELLLAEDLPPSIRQDVERIGHGAARCARIVRNLLTFARPAVQERQLVDLNRVVTLVLDLQYYRLRVDSIEVICDLAPTLPPVLADSYQLQQVLVNLIANAHHALTTVEGPRRLSICTTQDGESIRLTVEDTGPGISSEVLPRIFDPFFSTKRVGEGTGLGLSTAYSIVEAHGGHIDVQSEPGRGACFTVVLPVSEGEIAAAEGADGAAPSIRLWGKRVLVIDDEPIVTNLVQRILNSASYEVETANDGSTALDLLRSTRYDAIVMDLRMPGLDGPALYARLQDLYPQLQERVLFMTGDSVSEDSRDFLKRTGRPVIAKPFTSEALLHAVRKTMERG